MSEPTQTAIPVALVYGDVASSQTLRAALGEIGAQLVCDADIANLDTKTLAGSGAGVVLISLDAAVEQRLDEIYNSLDEDGYRVMFDDPKISNSLEGWEHARWQRHLAAKLRDVREWDPPRPVDVEAPPEIVLGAEPDWLGDALSLLQESPASSESTVEGPDPVEAGLPDETSQAVDNTDTAEPPTLRGETDFEVDAASFLLGDVAAEPMLQDLDTEIVDLSAAATSQSEGAVDPATEAVPADDTGDVGPDLYLDLDAFATEQLDDADPTPVPDAQGKPDEQDWDSLEAELNAAFDSDTLDNIDVASGAAPTPDTSAEPDRILADNSAEADVDALSPHMDELTPDDATSGAGVDAADSHDLPVEDVGSDTTGDFDFSDSDGWALVDYDITSGSASTVPESGETPSQGAGRPDSTEPEAVHDAAEDHDAALQEHEFTLELVDPVDYLAPAKPTDISNELYVMPELMPMAEAVAPKVGDDDEQTSASPAATRRLERLVVLGASIGGPDAVREFLSHLPEKFPATFVLVQHLGSEFVDLMVSQLGKSSALPVRIPTQTERAVPGEVLVVPNGRNLRIARDGALELVKLEEEGNVPASTNKTMAMAAETFGADTMAIIFSGMARDAVAGALEIAAHGGSVWVQEPQSCIVSNMVDDLIAAGVAKFSATPKALAERLIVEFSEEPGHE